jgi:hypothetical protein
MGPGAVPAFVNYPMNDFDQIQFDRIALLQVRS